MKKFFTIFTNRKSIPAILITLFLLLPNVIKGQPIIYNDSWGEQGYSLLYENPGGIELNFSITYFELNEKNVNGSVMSSVHLPSVFLPNDEGAPDLPGTSRFIALPQGANVSFQIVNSRTEVIDNIEIAPAFRIPKGTDDSPLVYAKSDLIYMGCPIVTRDCAFKFLYIMHKLLFQYG